MKNISFSLRFGLSLAFMILTTLASTGVGVSIYILTQKNFRENLRERLKNVSETAAALIDGEAHSKIRGAAAEQSQSYQDLRALLQKIRNANPDLRFVYTMRKENNKFYFVIDAEENPEEMSHVDDQYTEVTDSLISAFKDHGQTVVEEEFATDQWGTWLSAFAPIRDKNGIQQGIVGIDIAAEKVLSYERNLRNLIIVGCLITLLVSLFFAYVMASKISTSLSWLVREVSKVQKLDLTDSGRISSMIKEISEIGGAVEAMKSGLRSFKKYVPSDVVMDLLKLKKEANLSTEKRQLTIFFSDIADFTAISEQLSSEDLSVNLGKYLGRVSAVIKHYQGTVDKFIGDAVMAFWGAPLELKEHAINACNAALACQHEIKTLNEELTAKGYPPFFTRIGINTGEVIVGNIGHEERLSYTAIGDAVNLASRIESLNKLFSSEILISQETWIKVQDHFEARIVDSVVVKGKTQPMMIYELLSRKGELSASDLHFISNFNKAMEHFFERRFAEAIKSFKEVLFQRPQDQLAQNMIKRIEELEGASSEQAFSLHLVLREK